MRKIYNKLVRDNIPKMIEKSGRKAQYRVLEDKEEYIQALRNKLLEETNEFLAAQSVREMVDELNDIKEVVDAIADVIGIDCREMARFRYLKSCANGIYGKRYFLECVEEVDAEDYAHADVLRGETI